MIEGRHGTFGIYLPGVLFLLGVGFVPGVERGRDVSV